MHRIVHRYDPPERFVAGTVGEPGSRTFFLQARDGRRVTSVSLEKQQVEALAGRVGQILAEAAETSPSIAASVAAATGDDSEPLDTPITEDFRVGTLVLAWQPEGSPGGQRLVIQAYAVSDAPGVEAPEQSADGPTDDELAELEAEVEAVGAGTGTGETVETDPLDPVEEDTDALVVRLDPAAASAFARRCAAVVSAGRPPCPFCGRPLDPGGHLCPRANGYRPART